MRVVHELWAGVRDTVFVAAQVVTLGVLALVLGLVALNLLTRQPVKPSPQVGPSRPLAALVPTLVPNTSTPAPPTNTPAPTNTLVPTYTAVSMAAQVANATPGPSTAPPAQPPVGAPTQAPQPTNTPEPQPTNTPKPAATPTSAVPGQMMKVLPAPDGLPARVRAEPSTKAPILVRVPLGATVEVLGSTNGDELQPGNAKWLRIKWKDQTGYVYSTLIGEP